MKKHTVIALISCSINLFAQKPLDTIYANETKNVAMFFPEPIRQGITGANNFVFTYNREKEEYLGLLQATPGMESNLLAVTKGGCVYSFILKYMKDVAKLNYFIDTNQSIGEEKPIASQEQNLKPEIFPDDRSAYFQKFSEYLLKSKKEPLAVVREKGLKFSLEKMIYNASEVYMVFEIKNRTDIDFEVDYLKVFRENGNKKRKASYQALELGLIYPYCMPDQVKKAESVRFVYVLSKFVLGENEKLKVELKERNGGRSLVMHF